MLGDGQARAAQAQPPRPAQAAPLPPSRPASTGAARVVARGRPAAGAPLPLPKPPELVADEEKPPAAQASAEPAPAAPFTFPPFFGSPPAQEEPQAPQEPAVASLPPEPEPKPAELAPTPGMPSASGSRKVTATALPEACARLVEAGDIKAEPARDLEVKDGCSLPEPVSLSAIRLKDGRFVPLRPAAVMRCAMVAAAAEWMREDLAPALADMGTPVEAINVAASFGCRPRNRVKGARMSEHGFGNALDVGGFETSEKGGLAVRNAGLPVAFQKLMKASACTRFTTVLGPGSDGYHEDHIHVDLAQRRNGYKLCRWVIKEPGTPAVVAAPKPPRPPARPAEAASSKPSAAGGKSTRKGASSEKPSAKGSGG